MLTSNSLFTPVKESLSKAWKLYLRKNTSHSTKTLENIMTFNQRIHFCTFKAVLLLLNVLLIC